jgi:hypothetical protein
VPLSGRCNCLLMTGCDWDWHVGMDTACEDFVATSGVNLLYVMAISGRCAVVSAVLSR